jgi:Cys-tRNA(Pro)/Cys-tRNA(Cys) deacylase
LSRNPIARGRVLDEADHFEHEYVYTSREAASARGTNIEDAAKALVFEAGSGKLVECVVSGHRRVDLKKLKALLGEKDIALASPERVLHVTGCTVGSAVKRKRRITCVNENAKGILA